MSATNFTQANSARRTFVQHKFSSQSKKHYNLKIFISIKQCIIDLIYSIFSKKSSHFYYFSGWSTLMLNIVQKKLLVMSCAYVFKQHPHHAQTSLTIYTLPFFSRYIWINLDLAIFLLDCRVRWRRSFISSNAINSTK